MSLVVGGGGANERSMFADMRTKHLNAELDVFQCCHGDGQHAWSCFCRSKCVRISLFCCCCVCVCKDIPWKLLCFINISDGDFSFAGWRWSKQRNYVFFFMYVFDFPRRRIDSYLKAFTTRISNSISFGGAKIQFLTFSTEHYSYWSHLNVTFEKKKNENL